MDMAEGLSLFEQIGNRWEAGFWKGFLGIFALRRSEYVLAHEYAEERLQVMSELKDKPGMIMAFELLGQIALSQRDFKEMERICQNSHRISVDTGDKWEIQTSLRLIGVAALGQGDIQRAARIFAECVPMAREVGDQVGLAACLVHWAGIALASNQPAVAVQILATVDANLIKEKYKLHPDEQIDYDRYLAECRERLAPDSFASAWQSGSMLTLEQAILNPIPLTLLDLQGGVPDPEEVECDPPHARRSLGGMGDG